MPALVALAITEVKINFFGQSRTFAAQKNKIVIPAHTIASIMETARIEEVVGEFVNLKRRGSNLIGLCPFHQEKTPSFSVSPSRGLFKCFGCGKGAMRPVS